MPVSSQESSFLYRFHSLILDLPTSLLSQSSLLTLLPAISSGIILIHVIYFSQISKDCALHSSTNRYRICFNPRSFVTDRFYNFFLSLLFDLVPQSPLESYMLHNYVMQWL